MHLVPIPDQAGTPVIWINPDHLAAVTCAFRTTEHGVRLDVELKINGMQSFTAHLDEYPTRQDAAAGFEHFIDTLETTPTTPDTTR